MIDGDALEEILLGAIVLMETAIKALDAEDDEGMQMELKAYRDILNGVKEQATVHPEPEWVSCERCARNIDNGGMYPDGRTRCPIQEHYVLPKDGGCHLAEPYKPKETE